MRMSTTRLPTTDVTHDARVGLQHHVIASSMVSVAGANYASSSLTAISRTSASGHRGIRTVTPTSGYASQATLHRRCHHRRWSCQHGITNHQVVGAVGVIPPVAATRKPHASSRRFSSKAATNVLFHNHARRCGRAARWLAAIQDSALPNDMLGRRAFRPVADPADHRSCRWPAIEERARCARLN